MKYKIQLIFLHYESFDNWCFNGKTENRKNIPLKSIIPGYRRYSDSLKLIFLKQEFNDFNIYLYPKNVERGWITTGRFPPTLFIRNKNIPRIVVFNLFGDTSTRVTKTIPNHVSAKNRSSWKNQLFQMFSYYL